jgi:Co/Zn/Cd efflux system component
MFLLEVLAGYYSKSVSVLADSSDMLGDTLVYAFSLYVVTGTDRARAGVSLFKGIIMATFGIGIFTQIIFKIFHQTVPDSSIMSWIGFLALFANTICLFLLTRHRGDDINMRSTWLCSCNDIVANVGVLLAALFVSLTASVWPDIAVSFIIMFVFLRSAFIVLKESILELRQTTLCPAGTCHIDACKC